MVLLSSKCWEGASCRAHAQPCTISQQLTSSRLSLQVTRIISLTLLEIATAVLAQQPQWTTRLICCGSSPPM